MRSSSARRGSWFTGLTWKGIGLIALICVINGVRRTAPDLIGGEDPWLQLAARMALTTMYGLMIAVPVSLTVVAACNRAPTRAPARYIVIALAVAVSALASIAIAVAVETAVNCEEPARACLEEFEVDSLLVASWGRYGSLCALFTAVFVLLRIADESIERAQEADLDRARFVQRMQEARLRMLQAQIEPHFLFNTLANVRRLYQTAPADAAKMLDNLMRYFEVALPHMRADESTLGQETELIESYLKLQQIRMGRRLAFAIDIPDRLRDAKLPPMMLLTLAENAIKHGLAPLTEGGTVRVTAEENGNELQVRVADTGRGFARTSGGGTGLANIRARLAGTYGSAGRLSLAVNAPRGVIATIAVPLPAAGR